MSRVEFDWIKLEVRGDGIDPDELVHALDVDDAICGRKGEWAPSGKRRCDTSFFVWTLEIEEDADYRQHMLRTVACFADRVRPSLDVLRELAKENEVTVVLSLGYYGSGFEKNDVIRFEKGFYLDPQVLRILAELGLQVYAKDFLTLYFK